jgi:hypothetical protein
MSGQRLGSPEDFHRKACKTEISNSYRFRQVKTLQRPKSDSDILKVITLPRREPSPDKDKKIAG